MKAAVVITLFLFLGCRPEPPKLKSIGIQPIDFGDMNQLNLLRQQLADFYHCPVYVLSSQRMPPAFVNLTKGERYPADSVLGWLSRRRPDSVSVVLGLTRKDIFINKRNKPIWGVLGLGDCPGRVCVVSDFRILGSEPEKYPRRLRILTLHEIGHNLGLPHCQTVHCIMNDANEKITTVDSSGEDYCARCHRRLSGS